VQGNNHVQPAREDGGKRKLLQREGVCVASPALSPCLCLVGLPQAGREGPSFSGMI
jgi:hypothetical protein